ncbi:MAG: hypothetical protein ACI9YB_003509, partial [Halioglobus sp.]
AETRLWDQEARFFYFQASALDKDYQLPKFTFGHFFATEASKILKMLHGNDPSFSEVAKCLLVASRHIHVALQYAPKNTYYRLMSNEIKYLKMTLLYPERAHSEKYRKAHREMLENYAETGTIDRGLLSVDSGAGLFGRDKSFQRIR